MAAWKKCRIVFLLTAFHLGGIAQQTSDTGKHEPPTDFQKNSFVKLLQKRGTEETVRSIEKYNAGQIVKRQKYLIEEIRTTTQRANSYMKKGLDTPGIVQALEKTNASLKIVSDGIFINKGTVQTRRNLAVSSVILAELLIEMNHHKNALNTYTNNLINFRDKIDSLSMDSALYTFPSDSLNAIKYIQKVGVVVKEIGPIDTALDLSLSNAQDLQPQVDLMVFTLRSAREDIENFRKGLSARTFEREFANLNGPIGFSQTFSKIIQFSIAKERMAFNFYLKDNTGRLVILALLIILAGIFIHSLKNRLADENALNDDNKGQLVLRYPLLSSIMIITSLFQFIFIDPPFVFNFCFWLIPAVCLTILFNNFISKYWMAFWWIIVLLFILASTDNMILQASQFERWMMLLLSMAGVFYGTYILLNPNRHDLKEKGILYFIGFMVIFEIGAALFNIFGRYNLAKILLISGYSGVVIAILFLWTVRLINQGLSIFSRIYKHSEKNLFYINFDKLGDRVPPLFYFLLVIGWGVLVGRNFYEFRQIAAPFTDFLKTERTVGDYTFTINGLFVFLLILVCSMLISRIISFFASNQEDNHPTNKKDGKVTLGSWLLLIRILIISLGLFLAFAAAGIPMDKITIILGALGVGIGLGLQSLVNNLVSGLIIAFEKPVNVGDFIEVNDKPGTMKSIGFRSSVVTLSDGACLIIPNGDLLSQHLVNWTMGKNIKQLNLTLGVTYNTDLEKVKELLNKILKADERILKNPASQVTPKRFSPNGIDIELLFWVRHIRESGSLTGDIITQINREFKTAGIVIPYPQQDLHIRSISNAPSAGTENKEEGLD
jgi:potassium efflux system protein